MTDDERKVRRIIAVWAVLQFLIIYVYVGISAYNALSTPSHSYDDAPTFVDKFIFVWLSLGLGLFGAAFSLCFPLGLLWIAGQIWTTFSGEKSESLKTSTNLTIGDLAGIASAIHPRAGALLNVAANIDARTQALNVTAPSAPAHNPVDDERL